MSGSCPCWCTWPWALCRVGSTWNIISCSKLIKMDGGMNCDYIYGKFGYHVLQSFFKTFPVTQLKWFYVIVVSVLWKVIMFAGEGRWKDQSVEHDWIYEQSPFSLLLHIITLLTLHELFPSLYVIIFMCQRQCSLAWQPIFQVDHGSWWQREQWMKMKMEMHEVRMED